MFVVFALFGLFASLGKPIRLVAVLFTITILVAGLLGAAVARIYSQPVNRYLRNRWRGAQGQPASVPSMQDVVVSERSSA